jgi:hypothetical protein
MDRFTVGISHDFVSMETHPATEFRCASNATNRSDPTHRCSIAREARQSVRSIVALKQRTGKENCTRHFHRLPFQKDAEIRSQLRALAAEEIAFPQGARARVIVIAWNRIHRNPDLADRSACGRYDGGLGLWGIKEVPRHEDEFGPLFSRDSRDSTQHRDPLVLQEGTLLKIVDATERLAQLPIRRVDKAYHGVLPPTERINDLGSPGFRKGLPIPNK